MAGVSTTNSSNSADADGSATVFNFTFFVYSADHIKVYSVLDDVLTPITTGITKAINSNFIGGTVTFSVAPADAVGEILIRREVPYTQTTEFADITRYKETAIEAALNTLCLEIQQLAEDGSLSLKYNESSSVTDATVEEPVADAMLKFIGTTGRVGAGATSTQIENAAANAAQTAADVITTGNNVTAAQNAQAAAEAAVAAVALNNYAATTNPTVSDDSGDGYSVGSRWVNTSTDTLYECLDASVGAAVWRPSDEVKAGGSAGVVIRNSGGTTVATIGPANGTGVTFAGAVNAGSINSLTTQLSVANGGTGAASLTANSVILGNGTSALQTVAPGTSGNVLTSNGTTWASAAPSSSGINRGTQVSLSGASVDFAIPAEANRITIMWSGVAAASAGSIGVQLGDSGGVENSGYASTTLFAYGSNYSTTEVATNAFVSRGNNTGDLTTGTMTLVRKDGNQWVAAATARLSGSTIAIISSAGDKTLSGELTTVRINAFTSSNTATTFTAGTANVMWEL